VNQPLCRALTKQGASCRAPSLPNYDTCLSHTPELAGKVAEARRRGGTMAAKVRILEGKRLKLDSPAAVVKFTSGVVQDCLAGTVEVEVARTTLYGLGILLKAVEQARASDVEQMLAEVRALVNEVRTRRRA
jgi:hypothetical protein